MLTFVRTKCPPLFLLNYCMLVIYIINSKGKLSQLGRMNEFVGSRSPALTRFPITPQVSDKLFITFILCFMWYTWKLSPRLTKQQTYYTSLNFSFQSSLLRSIRCNWDLMTKRIKCQIFIFQATLPCFLDILAYLHKDLFLHVNTPI